MRQPRVESWPQPLLVRLAVLTNARPPSYTHTHTGCALRPSSCTCTWHARPTNQSSNNNNSTETPTGPTTTTTAHLHVAPVVVAVQAVRCAPAALLGAARRRRAAAPASARSSCPAEALKGKVREPVVLAAAATPAASARARHVSAAQGGAASAAPARAAAPVAAAALPALLVRRVACQGVTRQGRPLSRQPATQHSSLGAVHATACAAGCCYCCCCCSHVPCATCPVACPGMLLHAAGASKHECCWHANGVGVGGGGGARTLPCCCCCCRLPLIPRGKPCPCRYQQASSQCGPATACLLAMLPVSAPSLHAYTYLPPPPSPALAPPLRPLRTCCTGSPNSGSPPPRPSSSSSPEPWKRVVRLGGCTGRRHGVTGCGQAGWSPRGAPTLRRVRPVCWRARAAWEAGLVRR